MQLRGLDSDIPTAPGGSTFATEYLNLVTNAQTLL